MISNITANQNHTNAKSAPLCADPVFISKIIPIKEGDTVADFGAADGRLSLELALQHNNITIYCIDILQDLLSKLLNKAKELGLDSIQVIQANIEDVNGSTLPEFSVDVVVMSNFLFQVDNLNAVIKKHTEY